MWRVSPVVVRIVADREAVPPSEQAEAPSEQAEASSGESEDEQAAG